MVRINDDWVVDVDEYCYMLKRDLHRDTVRKTGEVEHRYKIVGYYQTLDKALIALGEQMNKETLSEGLHSLPQAVTAIAENRMRWEELVNEVLKEK